MSTRPALVVVEFLGLLGFWLVLSGQYSPLFIAMGVISAVLVTALTHRVVAEALGPPGEGAADAPVRILRAIGYGFWLLSRIPPAGFQVAYYVLHPAMPIKPGVLRFRTSLRSQMARSALANSITLVPGTLTLRIIGDEFVVHAFVPSSAADLIKGGMQQRIARVFLEEERDDPEATWQPPEQGTSA